LSGQRVSRRLAPSHGRRESQATPQRPQPGTAGICRSERPAARPPCTATCRWSSAGLAEGLRAPQRSANGKEGRRPHRPWGSTMLGRSREAAGRPERRPLPSLAEGQPLTNVTDRPLHPVQAPLQSVESRLEDSPERLPVGGAHRATDRANADGEGEHRADDRREGGNHGGGEDVADPRPRFRRSTRRTRRSPSSGSQIEPSGSARCRSNVAVATGIAVPPSTRRALASRASLGKQAPDSFGERLGSTGPRTSRPPLLWVRNSWGSAACPGVTSRVRPSRSEYRFGAEPTSSERRAGGLHVRTNAPGATPSIRGQGSLGVDAEPGYRSAPSLMRRRPTGRLVFAFVHPVSPTSAYAPPRRSGSRPRKTVTRMSLSSSSISMWWRPSTIP